MDDCQSFSSKPKWMERECQSLMCLMVKRDIEIERDIMNLLRYSLYLYCLIDEPDRALSLQPGYSHTAKMICTHSTILCATHRRANIFPHSEICTCCGARVMFSNFPLIFARPLRLLKTLISHQPDPNFMRCSCCYTC